MKGETNTHETGLAEEGGRPALYLWFDAEFTSLVLEEAALLQVALIATDVRFKRVFSAEEDVNLVVHLEPETDLSSWSAEHLSALIERCRSPEAVPVEEADAQLSNYAERAAARVRCSSDSPPILAGNSVHADWWMARRWLPRFSAVLHYRHLDVTSFKLAWLARGGAAFAKDDPATVQAWLPDARLKDGAAHDAYFDVQASVAEMAFYRARLLREPAARP